MGAVLENARREVGQDDIEHKYFNLNIIYIFSTVY